MVTSRIWFTAAQKAELWERWKNGQSAAAISRALERKNKTGVERIDQTTKSEHVGTDRRREIVLLLMLDCSTCNFALGHRPVQHGGGWKHIPSECDLKAESRHRTGA